MKITVLGTGKVGRTFAARLATLGHDVVIGTRDIRETLARSAPDAKGIPPFAGWHSANPGVRLMPFPEAGMHGELLINAAAGAVTLAVLEAVGAPNLDDKVLIDLAVPLDYSHGRPPRLAFANDDSLGEQIQRAFPAARVVKTLNTMSKDVMVDPARLRGLHNVFLAGEDNKAKEMVKGLLSRAM